MNYVNTSSIQWMNNNIRMYDSIIRDLEIGIGGPGDKEGKIINFQMCNVPTPNSPQNTYICPLLF